MLNLIFPTWLFFGVFFIDSWNLMNSISFITYRYMLATIFISHLTILGLSYKSIQSYQRKWSRNETWVRLTTYFHEYSKSTYCFHQILCYKVRTFWETQKVFLVVLTNQLIYLASVKTMRKIFQIMRASQKVQTLDVSSLLNF